MILSDREVRAAIQQGIISVSNCPPASDKRWASTTLDLTLDAEIRPWTPQGGAGADVTIDPSDPEFNTTDLINQRTIPVSCNGENGYVILPKALVLGWTVEKNKLPNASRIGARVDGKSSLARIGIGIHITAPIIHPGFGEKSGDPTYPGSPIRLEIWNIGPLKVRLKKGMPICQIIFEEVHGIPEKDYAGSGQYAVQGPPEA
jgi:dCTP deaminase